jgi:hypothetical protein
MILVKGCDSLNHVSVMLAAGGLAKKLPPKGSSNWTVWICQALFMKVRIP